MIITNQEKSLPLVPPELPSALPNRKERIVQPSANRPASTAPPPYTPHAPPPAVDLLGDDVDAEATYPPTSPGGGVIPANLPRQNRLKVHKGHHGIKETYVLDPSLPTPPGAPEEHLSLFSKGGHVFAKVSVTEGDVKGKVVMQFESKAGSVDVKIPTCPRNIPLQITALTQRYGNVFLLLPPKFNGPLVIEMKHGWPPRLLPSLKAVTRTLEENAKVHRYWVGDWNGDEEWKGDECLISTFHGHIWVGFWEEKEEKGWSLKKMFRF